MYTGDTTISHVNVQNSVASGSIAGLIGINWCNATNTLTISDCSVSFTASSPSNDAAYTLGGIIGAAGSGLTIRNCASSFNANGSYYYAGGIVGAMSPHT